MQDEYADGIRAIAGYSKNTDEDGNQLLEIKHYLKPVTFAFLHNLLGIDPNDPDPIIRRVILCYNIDKERAAAIQPYIVDGILDLNKYDYMLECYAKK